MKYKTLPLTSRPCSGKEHESVHIISADGVKFAKVFGNNGQPADEHARVLLKAINNCPLYEEAIKLLQSVVSGNKFSGIVAEEAEALLQKIDTGYVSIQPRIIIEIGGGLVQTVHSDLEAADVSVMDLDIEKHGDADDDEIKQITKLKRESKKLGSIY